VRRSHALDIIDALKSTSDLASVKDLILPELRRHGFDHFLCADLPQPGEALTDLMLVNEWNPAWADRYLIRNYVARDPMVHEIFRTAEPFRWHEVLERRKVPRADLRIVHEASEFRMKDGFVVPIRLLHGRMAVFTMAGEASNLADQSARAMLHLLAMYAHARMRQLKPLPPRKDIPELSPRERECLLWASAGKTDWEISEILHVGEGTINKHIESAKRRLGVTTRVQAVVHALVSGQIHV
jgi:LuxR family quorum sensing-dependent transcriptional regulator